MTRVLILAGSPFTLAGLRAAVSADHRFEIFDPPALVDERGSGGAQEDVILFDGLEGDIDKFLARSLKEDRSRRIVLLADCLTRSEATRLVHSGVQAILPRDSSANEITSALAAVSEDLTVFAPEFLRLLVHAPLESGEQEIEYPSDPLTARETEVLALLAAGAGNKEIAERLRISEHTAKFHVSSILSKLGATTRTEAVSRGYRLGLILI